MTAQKDNGCSVPVRAPEGVEGEATILVMLHEYLPDEDCSGGRVRSRARLCLHQPCHRSGNSTNT